MRVIPVLMGSTHILIKDKKMIVMQKVNLNIKREETSQTSPSRAMYLCSVRVERTAQVDGRAGLLTQKFVAIRVKYHQT